MGASPYAEAWAHFSFNLGLTEDLLPVVADHSVKPSPHSSVKALGKVPGTVGAHGAKGFPGWTEHRSTPAEIDKWMADPRLGVCIQTRRVRAIDIDVDDAATAQRIAAAVEERLGPLPWRTRQNSSKMLLAFIVEGELPKRSFRCEGGLVEFLGNGQQFIAASMHPSGVRYEWAYGLPEELPVIPADVFKSLWAALVSEFATEVLGTGSGTRQRGERLDVDDPVANWLYDEGLDIGEGPDRIYVSCPWQDGHSSDSGETEAAWLVAGSNSYTRGHYSCLHASCSSRSDDDFLHAIGFTASDFEDLGPIEDEPEPEPAHRRFEALPAGDFVKRDPPRWLVKNILPEAQLGMVYGASGAGKSFFVLDLVAAVARGEPWRGNRVARPTNVVYICAEGAGGFRNRVAAYAQQHGDFTGGLFVIPAQPDFLGAEDTAAVIREVLAVGGGLVVVDTLAQTTPGGDENSAQDMGKAIKHCRKISEKTGAMVLLVHHAGKDAGRGARGWSGIRAAADVEIEVAVSKSGVRVARLTKQKDGQDGTEFGFTLAQVNLGMDADGDVVTSCVIEEADVPVEQEKVALPSGAVQRAVLVAFHDAVVAPGEGVIFDAVLDAYCEANPLKGGEKDRRRTSVKRAVDGLIEGGWLIDDGGFLFAAGA